MAQGRPEGLVVAADVAWQWCGDADEAWRLLEAAGSTAPDALRLRAQVCEARGDRAGAALAWEMLAATSRGSVASEALRRASVMGSEGGPTRAADLARAAVQADPSDLAAWRLLADRASAADLPAEAERAELAIAERVGGPAAADTLRRVATRRQAAGDLPGAVEALRRAYAADPGSPEVWVELEAVASAAGDEVARGELYGALGADARGADAAWWWTHAARAQRSQGDGEGAAASYTLAVTEGSRVAAWEQLGWLLTSRRMADLAEAAQAAAELTPAGPEAEQAWTFAAVCREIGLRDPAGAAAAWARAGSGEAAQAGQARCLRGRGDDTLSAHLRERAGESPARLLALAEHLERTDVRSPEARELYAALSEVADADRRSLEGLLRLARRTDDAPLLVRALERLADRAPSRDRKSGLQVEAAMIRRYRLGDASGASALLMQAPPASTARELQVGLMVESGHNEQAAALLEGEAGSASADDAADLLYRAALLRWVAPGGDADPAPVLALVDRALALQPDNRDASSLLAEAGGLERADRGTLAPDVAASVALLSGEDVELPPGAGLAAVHAAARGDAQAWRTCLEACIEPERHAWIASLAADATAAAAALVAGATEGAPCVGAALLAHRAGHHAEAVRYASGAQEGGLRVLAWQRRLAGGEGHEEALTALAAHDPAASAWERWLGSGGEDVAGQAEAAEALAALAEGPARALYARSAALGWREAGDPARAVAAWRQVMGARPEGREAWDGLVDAARALADVDVIQELGAEASPLDGDELARTRAALLLTSGAPGAVDAWALAATSGQLVDQLGWEVALAEAGQWSELFGALTQRTPSVVSPEERSRIESARRWILAEKLSQTEEAWTLYQQLHREVPDDRDVLERLARIAGARGETELAVGYLTELAESAPTSDDAARCHRRIAEVWLVAGDDAYARQAYFNALDAQPSDAEALTGLRGIAERAQDWPTLITVMKRESTLRSGREQATALREVAHLTEQHLSDAGAAVDAWRAVVDADPEDLDGWRRLMELAEANGEYEAFLETASGVDTMFEGNERSALLRRMGTACEQLGRTEDAVHYYEQSVAAEEPDLEAASRLEHLYRDSYDWSGVSRALSTQARHAADPATRLLAWLEAARIEREQRHDREAASQLYDEALQVDPTCLTALWFQCIWLYESGRSGEALPLYAQVEPRLDEELATGGEDAPIAVASFLYRYAELLRSAGREEEAMQRYLAALTHVPVHLPSLEAVGPLLIERGEWEKAREVWRHLLEITGGVGDPQKRAQVHTMLGLIDQAEGRSELAFKRFTRALEAFPNHVPALRGLASELEAREDWNAMLPVYNAVIYHATAPQDFIDAYMIKGRVLDEHLGRPDKAVQHYERSLAFEGRQPLACLRLSELALRRGAWDDALSYAARGVDVASDNPRLLAELHVARALALVGLDDASGASLAVDAARAADPAVPVGDDPLRDPGAAITALRARLPR